MAREFCTGRARPASIAAMKYLHVAEQPPEGGRGGRGGRYVASLRETAAPVPGRGEVLIRVTASGVNRADLSQIAGRYPPPPGESEILGLEVSGVRDDTDEPVCALLAGGGHAQYVAAPAGQVFPAPTGLDLATAAGTSGAGVVARNEGHLGRGAVDNVVGPLGGAALGRGLRGVRVGGRIVILPTMSGSRTELDLGLLMKKRARVVGSTLRARSRQ